MTRGGVTSTKTRTSTSSTSDRAALRILRAQGAAPTALLCLYQLCQVRMSTPRKPSGGPADATANIAERAWRGTVASAVVVPTVQLILLRFANALQPYAGDTLAVDPMALLTTGIVVLGVVPVVSTLGSTLFAYLTAGWPGVLLYYVISTGASMMLGCGANRGNHLHDRGRAVPGRRRA